MTETISQVKGHENDFENLIIRGNIQEPIDLTNFCELKSN